MLRRKKESNGECRFKSKAELVADFEAWDRLTASQPQSSRDKNQAADRERRLGRESGSANSARRGQYVGSRSSKHRYEYSESSYAGFVLSQPALAPEPSEFFEMLKAVPNVEKVAWNTKKTSQGNVGRHYCEQNILVTSSRDPSHAIEFELTRNQHMKDPVAPYTFTTCFKQPVMKLVPEAWRILLEVTKGHELLPIHVAAYQERVLSRWRRALDNAMVTDLLERVRQTHGGPCSTSPQMVVAEPREDTEGGPCSSMPCGETEGGPSSASPEEGATVAEEDAEVLEDAQSCTSKPMSIFLMRWKR